MMTGSALVTLVWAVAPLLLTRRATLEYAARVRDRNNLERYFPRSVFAEILRRPDRLHAEGQRAAITVMYSDIRGYTTSVEQLQATEVFEHLNDYFGAVSEVIDRHKGSIQHFVGDQILAFWGVPLPLEPSKAASLAVEAALATHTRLVAFREEKGAIGGIFRSGFGIASGEVIAGNMGSVRRFDYGFVGDVMNLGSRVESLTRHFGVSILADQSTVSLLDGRIPLRRIGPVVASGRRRQTVVYEVLAGADERTLSAVRNYEEALRLAEEGRAGEAILLLDDEELQRSDPPSVVLLRHLRELGDEPFGPFRFSK